MALEILARRAAEFGAPLDADQLAAFEAYRSALLEWNQRANLTSVTDPDAIEIRHFVDSLSCLPAIDDLFVGGREARLVDVGAGAGFPGIPLKLARPAVGLTLLDSVGKKTAFLAHLVELLGLRDVDVVTARAEELAHARGHRERYTVALARALAPLPVLLELCLPFVAVGGRLVAPRRGDLAAQQSDATRAAEVLGGRFRPPTPVDLAPGLEGYGLVVVEKVARTPTGYPRRTGLPARRPIG